MPPGILSAIFLGIHPKILLGFCSRNCSKITPESPPLHSKLSENFFKKFTMKHFIYFRKGYSLDQEFSMDSSWNPPFVPALFEGFLLRIPSTPSGISQRIALGKFNRYIVKNIFFLQKLLPEFQLFLHRFYRDIFQKFLQGSLQRLLQGFLREFCGIFSRISSGISQ